MVDPKSFEGVTLQVVHFDKFGENDRYVCTQGDSVLAIIHVKPSVSHYGKWHDKDKKTLKVPVEYILQLREEIGYKVGWLK